MLCRFWQTWLDFPTRRTTHTDLYREVPKIRDCSTFPSLVENHNQGKWWVSNSTYTCFNNLNILVCSSLPWIPLSLANPSNRRSPLMAFLIILLSLWRWGWLMWFIVTLFLIYIQAFLLIKQDSFHGLLHYCRPGLLDKDIPKRKTIKAEILRRAQLAEEKVCNKLKVCLHQIALYLFTCFEQGVVSKYPLHLMHEPLGQGIRISLLQPTTLMLHQSILWTGSWRLISSPSRSLKGDTLAKICQQFWLTQLIDTTFEEK